MLMMAKGVRGSVVYDNMLTLLTLGSGGVGKLGLRTHFKIKRYIFIKLIELFLNPGQIHSQMSQNFFLCYLYKKECLRI